MSQYSQENICIGTFIKNILQRRLFPVNLAKFLTVAFFVEQVWWLLLVYSHLNLSISCIKSDHKSFLTLLISIATKSGSLVGGQK